MKADYTCFRCKEDRYWREVFDPVFCSTCDAFMLPGCRDDDSVSVCIKCKSKHTSNEPIEVVTPYFSAGQELEEKGYNFVGICNKNIDGEFMDCLIFIKSSKEANNEVKSINER